MKNLLFLIMLIFFLLENIWFPENLALPNIPGENYCPKNNNFSKICLLREKKYSQPLWNHYTGNLCYFYSNEARFIKKYKSILLNFTCNNEQQFQLPVAIINISTVALFDYDHTDSLLLIKKSFKSEDLFENYLRCCKEAVNCCNNDMNNENIKADKNFCPVIWDAWTCFPKTPVNRTKRLKCSSQVYQSPDKVCVLESEKHCLWNQHLNLAEWNQTTDYTSCAMPPIYLKRYNYHVYALSVCIVVSLPAILIFSAIPTFRETIRVILHRNLLISIVIRNTLTILAREYVIIDALKPNGKHVMETNTILCRILTFFGTAATNSTYACMLLDGYYLHKVIVRTFATTPKIRSMYIVLIVLTFLPSIIYATILGINQRESCWMVDVNGEQWTVDSFRMLILIINTILLLDIIRIMISKMKQGGPTRQTKAAFRATLFLIPLFGLHIFITAKKIVINNSCLAEDIYDYFRYTMEAIQGIFVAILFCYANQEVHNELKNLFRKITINLNQRWGWNIGETTENNRRRRTTTASYVSTSN